MEFIVLTVFSIRLVCSTEGACLPAGGVGWDPTAQSEGLSHLIKCELSWFSYDNGNKSNDPICICAQLAQGAPRNGRGTGGVGIYVLRTT